MTGLPVVEPRTGAPGNGVAALASISVADFDFAMIQIL
jgi:hypothetical protein